MKNIRIDYYTGTSGTELVARLLAGNLKSEKVDVQVNRMFRNNIINIENLETDYYILLFPVHSFNAPQLIYEWIRYLQGNHCKTAVISVSGGGNALSNTACRVKTVKLLKNNNFNVIFEDMVRMPNNWMKVPDKEKFTKILSQLPNKIDEISKKIISEKAGKKTIYWVDYVIIEIENQSLSNGYGKPKFGNRCDMCLGCVYNCPHHALQPAYAAFQVDKKGYNIRLMCKNAGIKLCEIFE